MSWFKRQATKKPRTGFRLSVESLESRELLAGDVFANVLANGTLLISGDAEANKVSIHSVEGSISVTGIDGTELRSFGSDTSVPNMQFSAESVSEITMDSKSGDDQLSLEGDFGERSVQIFTSGGNDTVTVGSEYLGSEETGTNTGALAIYMGRGSDIVWVHQTSTIGNVDLTMGYGSEVDEVYTDGLQIVGNLTINNGNSAGNSECVTHSDGDYTELRNQMVCGDVQITGSAGTQCVSVDDTHAGGDVSFKLGSGDDQASLVQSQVTGDTAVNMSSGNDSFQAIRSDLHGETTVLGGLGDDRTEIVDSYLNDRAVIHGGRGNSDLSIVESQFEDVLITGSGEQDDIRVTDSDINGDLKILAGGGDDSVQIRSDGDLMNYIGGDATIITGGGHDQLTLAGYRLDGSLTVWAGGGEDSLSIAGVVSPPPGSGGEVVILEDSDDTAVPKKWFVHTGGGKDTLTFDDSTTIGDVDIVTAAGDDTAEMQGNVIHGGLNVQMGRGGDSLAINVSGLEGSQFLHGGAGTDELVVTDAEESFEEATVRAFETQEFNFSGLSVDLTSHVDNEEVAELDAINVVADVTGLPGSTASLFINNILIDTKTTAAESETLTWAAADFTALSELLGGIHTITVEVADGESVNESETVNIKKLGVFDYPVVAVNYVFADYPLAVGGITKNIGGTEFVATAGGWADALRNPANNDVINTLEDDLYLRSNNPASNNYDLNFAVPNYAEYKLKLHFAEHYWPNVGDRVFDVSIEGNTPAELTAVDLVAKGKAVDPVNGGRHTAFDYVTGNDVVVADGNLTLNFDASGGSDTGVVGAVFLSKSIDAWGDEDSDGLDNYYDKCLGSAVGANVGTDGCYENILADANADFEDDTVLPWVGIVGNEAALAVSAEDALGGTSFGLLLDDPNSETPAYPVTNVNGIELPAASFPQGSIQDGTTYRVTFDYQFTEAPGVWRGGAWQVVGGGTSLLGGQTWFGCACDTEQSYTFDFTTDFTSIGAPGWGGANDVYMEFIFNSPFDIRLDNISILEIDL